MHERFRRIPARVAQMQRSPAEFSWILGCHVLLREIYYRCNGPRFVCRFSVAVLHYCDGFGLEILLKLCLYIHNKSELHVYNIGPCLHFNNEPVDTFWNVQCGWFCQLVKLTQRCPGSPKSSHSKVFSFGKLCFTKPAPFTSGIFTYIHLPSCSSNWVFQNSLSLRYSVFLLQR